MQGTRLFEVTLAVIALGVSSEARTQQADLILENGTIYTVEAKHPWAHALAIAGGRFIFVGSTRGAHAHAGPATRVVDLHGAFAMPGIVDVHVHPVMGGLKALFECNFPFTAIPDQIAAALKSCVISAPAGDWIRGGQWDSGFFENHPIESPRGFLDRITDEHPIMLIDDSEHNAWVNSAALQAAGIDATTPDPPGGHIVRAPDGEPNGILLEGAFRVLFRKSVPSWTPEQHVAAVREANRRANQYGITTVQDAGAYDEYLQAYDEVDHAGQLTLHVAACLRTPTGVRTEPLDYASLEARRDRYRSPHVQTDFVKIFLDGVPTSARTAAMLAPYLPEADRGAASTGNLLVPEDVLSRDLIELDHRGFTVKMHAAGDRAIRVGLNAIAAARRQNGASGLHHMLAHAGYIDPQDIGRFKTLDTVADFSPEIWFPSPIISSILRAVGPRGEHYWPTHTLLESGAAIAGGTDWPAAVPDENPWVGIEALVTRRDPRGATSGSLWPEEAIDLTEALRIYTANGARALKLDQQVGSIAVGKSADLVVLNQNLFKISIDRVGKTKARMTYFEGNLVYTAPQ